MVVSEIGQAVHCHSTGVRKHSRFALDAQICVAE
jgi:hypothetical protein